MNNLAALLTPFLSGYRVILDPLLTKTEHIRGGWFARLLDIRLGWNPCDQWLNPYHRVVTTPSDKIIISGNSLIAHPDVINKLRGAGL